MKQKVYIDTFGDLWVYIAIDNDTHIFQTEDIAYHITDEEMLSNFLSHREYLGEL